MKDKIEVRGARENNLKNIDVDIPKNKIVVMTGPSGSGKTTLAFDTIYNEGKRRYVESLSAYARQFLGGSEKPDVDSIEGLSPAISIDQKTTNNNPRSTVGTVTEINDYLRLLYARIGVPICPNHNIIISQKSPKEIQEIVYQDFKNEKIQILSPIIELQKGTHVKLFDELKKEGYNKVIVNGSQYDLLDEIKLEKNKKHTVKIIIDRLVPNMNNKARLLDSIEKALEESDGAVEIMHNDQITYYSQNFSCPKCNFTTPKLEPRLFSFNAPLGACPTCEGLGQMREPDIDLLVPDKSLSIDEGAIVTSGFTEGTWYMSLLMGCLKAHKIKTNIPFSKYTKEEVEIIKWGSDKEFLVKYEFKNDDANVYQKKTTFEGVCGNLMRRYIETQSNQMREYISKFMTSHNCPTCQGKRYSQEVLAVKINNLNIADVSELSIEKTQTFFKNLKLTKNEKAIAKLVLAEINTRLSFLYNVGLDYLTLSRSANTLSGGEAQRIRLATQIGSKLTGVLYVLDEPSIGLHQRDNDRLIDTLKQMKELGNTLLVVEHDEDTMLEADYIIDMGPGAGNHGGEVIALGTPKQIMKNKKSLTGQYLSGIKKIDIPKKLRDQKNWIEIKGARENNLQNISLKIPTNNFITITGVSGSGKSTLINQILYKALSRHFSRDKTIKVGEHDTILGLENIKKVIQIDQKPIGRTPRSNPATYISVFDNIRDLYAELPESKMLGYQKGRFSFNVRGGRCEHCQGDGVIKIEMHFLPDVYVKCDKCNGKRYNEEVLEIKYKNKNIADVLSMSIEEANEFFKNHPIIHRKLQTLVDVGLGYMKLGAQATTLSGGEAQRVKLSKELQRVSEGNSLYILDEPTTGLHIDDIKKLIKVLQRIVDNGNTVVIIEHNLDLIKVSDYIIDLGPEGGMRGGKIIATGKPSEIAKSKQSYTGKYLKKYLTK